MVDKSCLPTPSPALGFLSWWTAYQSGLVANPRLTTRLLWHTTTIQHPINRRPPLFSNQRGVDWLACGTRRAGCRRRWFMPCYFQRHYLFHWTSSGCPAITSFVSLASYVFWWTLPQLNYEPEYCWTSITWYSIRNNAPCNSPHRLPPPTPIPPPI